MGAETAWIFLVCGLVAAAALMAAWSRQEGWERKATTCLFVLSLPVVAVAAHEVLGNHRPVTWQQVRAMATESRFPYLGSKIIYEEAIYLYLDQPGAPLALKLPWSLETAQNLQDALQEAHRNNGQLNIIIPPFDKSLNKKAPPQFEVLPPPKFGPPKDPPAEIPTYDRDA